MQRYKIFLLVQKNFQTFGDVELAYLLKNGIFMIKKAFTL